MTFDAMAFMNATMDQALDTRILPMPEGEYLAQVEKLVPRTGTGKNGENWTAVDVFYAITGPEVEAMNLKKKVVKGGFMLDLLPNGNLDLGPQKNVAFGRFREALGMNVPGQPFSPAMAVGQMVKVRIKHRPNPDNAEIVYDEVAAVTRAA